MGSKKMISTGGYSTGNTCAHMKYTRSTHAHRAHHTKYTHQIYVAYTFAHTAHSILTYEHSTDNSIHM